MTADHRELAETFLAMLNSHDPDAVDRFVAVGYINHNAFVAHGREANRGPLFGSRRPDGRSRCAPSTSGASPTVSSPSTGTSSTTWRSSSNSA
jgi:hypothetical protein